MTRPIHFMLKLGFFMTLAILWLQHSCPWAIKVFENRLYQTLFIVIPYFSIAVICMLVLVHEVVTPHKKRA